jgi:hypothetical protein
VRLIDLFEVPVWEEHRLAAVARDAHKLEPIGVECEHNRHPPDDVRLVVGEERRPLQVIEEDPRGARQLLDNGRPVSVRGREVPVHDAAAEVLGEIVGQREVEVEVQMVNQIILGGDERLRHRLAEIGARVREGPERGQRAQEIGVRPRSLERVDDRRQRPRVLVHFRGEVKRGDDRVDQRRVPLRLPGIAMAEIKHRRRTRGRAAHGKLAKKELVERDDRLDERLGHIAHRRATIGHRDQRSHSILCAPIESPWSGNSSKQEERAANRTRAAP